MENKIILIHCIRLVGHFTIYASNLINWILEQKGEVLFLGHDFENTIFFRTFKNNSKISFIDINTLAYFGSSFNTDKDIHKHFFSEESIKKQIVCIKDLQKKYSPFATVLINSDDMLCGSQIFATSKDLFLTPTYPVCTFAHRDYYSAYKDVYSQRLDTLIQTRHNFNKILTLDEYQVQTIDPAQSHLVFLPDIYKTHDSSDEEIFTHASDLEHRQFCELQFFLDSGKTPLIPILGKFDDRKNNIWLLRQAEKYPDLAYIILGERVPGCDDAEIDFILQRLKKEKRLYAILSFTPEYFLSEVLSSSRIKFLPLAYQAHYGSSGIQLQALEHEIPCLVPDMGLMARRVIAHNLGQVFYAGDYRDFSDHFDRMLNEDLSLYKSRTANFISFFSKENVWATFDYLFGLTKKLPLLPYAHDGKKNDDSLGYYLSLLDALNKNYKGNFSSAIDSFDSALQQCPEHKGILVKKIVASTNLGCVDCYNYLANLFAENNAETKFLAERIHESAEQSIINGEFADADKYLNRLIGIAPQNAKYRFLQARCLFEQSKIKECLQLIETVSKGKSASEKRIFNKTMTLKAKCLHSYGNPQEALAVLEQILTADRHNYTALHFKSVILQGQKQYIGALSILEYLTSHPDKNLIYYLQTKGGVLAALGRYYEAIHCFERIIELTPDFLDAYLNLSDVFRYAKKHSQALIILDKLEKINRKFKGLHFKRGQIYQDMGEFGRAADEFGLEK